MRKTTLNRRTFLAGSVSAGVATAIPATSGAQVATKAKIVVVGGGAGGLTISSRLARALSGAEIVVVEPNSAHYYQPGFTLIGAGLKPPSYAVLGTDTFVHPNVRWVKSRVAEFVPDANYVATEAREKLTYDFLVVSTGLTLDYEAIEGMDRNLIGSNGIASVYAGPEAAAISWKALAQFAETGGVGLFGRPATEMKCAGAPLKQTFLADDYLRRQSTRARSKIIYNAHNTTLFSVPRVDTKVRQLFARQDFATNFGHVLTKIDPSKRIATYKTVSGNVEMKWDFINLIPPMRAPVAVRKSPLAWQTGPFAADGWIEVDQKTLRHIRYGNVFGVGDINGVPKGKTAASVKWQAPVVAAHIIADISGKPSNEIYNGYTSCPLITKIGQAMLVEFDYANNLTPSFPFIDPLEEHWLPWVIKEALLKPNYTAMLRGLA